MPTISMFLGIIISMYYMDAGNLPQKQRNYVVAWATFHEEDLKADWELAVNGKEPFKIDPLRF